MFFKKWVSVTQKIYKYTGTTPVWQYQEKITLDLILFGLIPFNKFHADVLPQVR
jgi:hypothetical protein